ncbi:MAG: LAGLIDADG family homing endonuclease [Armatimonadota bacterium]|nr:LAGLIDADG family homing endonuclease [Armatimonadota bacterium]
MVLVSRGMPPEVHGHGRFVIRAADFVPAYVRTYEEGRLRAKVEEALEALRDCRLCPRDCGVDRLANRFAVCKTGRYARVSSFFHHFGEEDVLRGWNGSGTIFFAWCNLRCVFCLSPDVRVLTDRGALPIGEIFDSATGREVTLPDGSVRFVDSLRVYTHEGRLAPVAKVFRHAHRGEMVVVKPYGLPAITVTANHAIFAAPAPGAAPRKVLAADLTERHLLFIPSLPADGAVPEIDTRTLLEHHRTSVRVPATRRVPVALLRALLGSTASPRLTSRAVGLTLGYHPAYVRTLRGRLRRGLALHDSEHLPNVLVERGGRVRFKTEKGPGVPCRLQLDEGVARLLGYYCAEGHVTSARSRPNSHRLIFSFGLHEPDKVHHVRTLLQTVFGVTPSVRTRSTTITVEVGNSALALLFASLCGHRAAQKRVPPPLATAPKAIVRAFLEAYLAGDGCWHTHYIAASTVSEDLALGLMTLFLRVGVFPYFYATPRSRFQTLQGRRVRQRETLYYVKCRRAAWEGIGPDERVRHFRTEHGFWVPIRRISRIPYDGPVYNLEVADDAHSFLVHGVAIGNCQNYETSQIGEGVEVTPRDLARMMLQLQAEGCHNINFVTPEHVVPQILEGVLLAVEGGLRLPLVYNTGAYDSEHSIRLMDGVVDIYMPDFKLWDRERSRRYLLAPDYPEAARRVIRMMHEQVGELKVTEDGLAVRGLLVRHLVMPGALDDTREIMNYLAGLSRDTYVNIMDQYYPAWRAKTEEKFKEINRRITRAELEQALAYARAAGLWRFDVRWRRVPRAAWGWG